MTGPTVRPRVLVATSHFPRRRRGDVTGNFVVDPVLALAESIDFRVVTPADDGATPLHARFEDTVDVRRFRYWWPRRAQAVAYRHGIPTNLRESWLARLQLPAFAIAFGMTVLRHARWADVVHAHWLPVALLCLPARWRHGTPVAVTLHGTDITQFPAWFSRFALRRMDAVVTAHEDLYREARRLAPDVPVQRVRHLVEPQPVDDAELRRVREQLGTGPVVVFVARLSSERDPLTFVRAAAVAVRDVPDARFAIVGDGALAADVDREIRRLGLREHVVRFGHRDDVWTFLRLGLVFAALSDRNNIWVTAMVEAMRAGLPVVATTSGDTAEALTDEKDALLVPVGDADATGRAIVRLLRDPDLRRRLAEGATAKLAAVGFDPDEVRDRTMSLYLQLAGRA